LTDIPDDEEEEEDNGPFCIDDLHNIQEYEDTFVINTNFDPNLEENRKIPFGISGEERLQFTNSYRECVKKHTYTPSTLEELDCMVC
jgi:hypothetical protein